MEPDWSHPDPALLRLRRTVALVILGLVAVVAAVALGTTQGAAPAVAGVLVVLALLALVLRLLHRTFHAIAYAERGDDLLVRRGVLVRRLSVVPYGRMQFVDVVAGPLARRYGLATLVLHTAAAASDAALPGLRADEAARLRDRLAALGEARAAGV